MHGWRLNQVRSRVDLPISSLNADLSSVRLERPHLGAFFFVETTKNAPENDIPHFSNPFMMPVHKMWTCRFSESRQKYRKWASFPVFDISLFEWGSLATCRARVVKRVKCGGQEQLCSLRFPRVVIISLSPHYHSTTKWDGECGRRTPGRIVPSQQNVNSLSWAPIIIKTKT